ncbi:MAG: hypothetical protein Q7U89_03235 [Coriobacteriia bacterium]|nr:hypothetical protein [Coriobacteriia bacterium]
MRGKRVIALCGVIVSIALVGCSDSAGSAGVAKSEEQASVFSLSADSTPMQLTEKGGGVAQGGVCEGYATFTVNGEYDGPAASFLQSFGEVKGTGRDDKLRFISLMHANGLASLNMAVSGPNVSASYNKDNIQGDSPVPFSIKVTGEDVQVEIPNVGIFPGKILRTEK